MRELNIPNSIGFCKNCWRSRRDGSAYCGECQDEPNKKFPIYQDNTINFPLLNKVMKQFGIKSDELDNVVFTYGNTIYGSSRTMNTIPFHLVAHEITHVFQQLKMGEDEWWNKYLKDEKFRLEQEVEAYRQQYKVAKNKGDELAAYVLDRTADDLSGRLYGKIVDKKTAVGLIAGKFNVSKLSIEEMSEIKQ